MGTRGTLRVYLNDELKVRQYNQWDSYPTSQFANICSFFYDAHNVERLADTLANVELSTRDIFDHAKAKMSGVYEPEPFSDEGPALEWLYMLLDRDFGSDILWVLAGAPPAMKYLPDWAMHFDADDLDPEEGNYVVKIYCRIDTSSFGRKSVREPTISFKLGGEYHGEERWFPMDHIPTDREIKDWEYEADKEE